VVACDGLSALRKVQSQKITEPTEAHYDLISAIRSLQQRLPLQVTFKHVKGHQDTGQTMVLSREAWMNIKMDEQAKRKVSVDGPHEQLRHIPYEGWSCLIEGKRITKHLTETLRQYLTGGPLLNHWAMRQRFKPGTETQIDWNMTAKAMRALPRAKQIWISKYSARFLPYGTNMTHWQLGSQAKCPRCPCHKEDKEHVLRCPAESAVAEWKKALEQLDNWMQATKTNPQLRQDILAGLRRWHDEEANTAGQTEDSEPSIIQASIGWGLALEGCVAMRWREEQDNFWKACKSRKSSKRWTTALITRLMMTDWDMWQHRNKALHESDVNRQEIIEDAINQQISQVYEQGHDHLPPVVRPLMKRSLPQLLCLPAPYKRQWMATIEAVRKQVQSLIG